MAFQEFTKGGKHIRFYCALCQRQCHSQVGFTKHCKHPEHIQRELVSSARIREGHETQYSIDNFSAELKQSIVQFVAERAPSPFLAHEVYRNIMPNDRPMKKMQESCWGTLGRFCAHLRECGDLH